MYDYDSLDFHHGLEYLEDAESRGDQSRRREIIEIMLGIFEGMGGTLHHDLQDYITELYFYPDDPADFAKLHQLHYEFVVPWASSMDYERSKEEQKADFEEKKVELLLPFARRDINLQNSKKNERLTEVNDWIEKKIEQQPDATRDALWEQVPLWITDLIGIHRFRKRVSAVRKKNKK